MLSLSIFFLVCSLKNVYDIISWLGSWNLVWPIQPQVRIMWHCLNLIYLWQHQKKSLQHLTHLLLVFSLTFQVLKLMTSFYPIAKVIHNRLYQISPLIPIPSFITMHQSPPCRQCVCCYHGLLHFRALASRLSVVYWTFFTTFSSRRTTLFLQSMPMLWGSCKHF